ncbi:aromatic ring-hydroxylating dioxygenase subunit alpha [Mycolicibacterium sp. BiH015]|uniref:aromatic ring-hydroxylating oxygenase subunit alpha n=1 Tax=Mycolicibacterium sp. BiH015 TaxID=3018808 RepID=UPI0022E5065E|nr:aromatic ring-hydroxylating dioxygenase subunit alpha [Mycolicibacterium sp. BiH015]MDA2889950.1 aromatic ring-hydroxylating dioxygenase subunit alpha [Mycolicibacterium sp. BiH015]
MSEQTFSFEAGAGLDDVLAPVRRAAEYTSTQLPSVPSMTRRVLDHVEANTLDIAEVASVIPADTFTSMERFAADQKMMRQVPHVVAWGGEIAEPGDYTTKEVMGTPVLLLRDSHGAARAFVNVCAHRGAQVAEGCGRAPRFTCPYHAWSYDADGRLASLPGRRMFDGVELSQVRLRALPVGEQAGLIVVALDDSVSVDGFLDDAAADLADFGFEHYAHAQSVDLPLRANWKLAVDVNFEGYHFPFLHKDTLAPIVSNNSVFDVFGAHCRWAFPFRNIAELRGVPEQDWPERFSGSVVYGIFPSCVLVESPVSTLMLRIYPAATPGTCIVHMVGGALRPMVSDDDRVLAQAGFDGATAVLRDEDFPAAEACQRGAENRLDNIIIGRSEPLVQHLHREWDAAINGV